MSAFGYSQGPLFPFGPLIDVPTRIVYSGEPLTGGDSSKSGRSQGSNLEVDELKPAVEQHPAQPAISTITVKIQRQMKARGWTIKQILEAFEAGQPVNATNKLTGGTEATRYVHPTTGQSVVIDDLTGEVIHIGGPGFRYP